MTIINALPNNIHNGDPLDAVAVMANFNQIVSNVNAGAAGLTATNIFTQPQNGVAAILPGQLAILSQVQALIAAAIPTGMIMDFGGGAAPTGFALCDGSAVSRTDPVYSGLFAVIGTVWGAGNGVSTYNLPNLARRATIGSGGSGSGTIGSATGSYGGEENHTLSVSELAVHNHGVSDPGHNHGFNDPGHVHGVNDPTHAHGVADPGHAHGINGNYMSNNLTGGAFNPVGAQAYGVGGSTNGAATGIGIYGAATGIAIVINGTNAYLSGAYTGIGTQNNGGNTAHNTMQPSAVVTKVIKL